MHPAWIIAGGFLAAAAAGLVFTPWIRGVANRRHWTDAPDKERKIHTEDVPRVGGVAIVCAFLVGLGYFVLVDLPADFVLPSWYIVVGALFIGGVGFMDDLFGLHFSHKFTAQVVVGIFMICGGYRFEVLPEALSATPLDLGWWITGILTVTWIVGITNAVNLLDGMDGLAAGVAVIAVASLTGVQMLAGDVEGVLLATVVTAALLGFLVFNFNPASIFMGDTGSFFVGFLLAIVALPQEAPGQGSWLSFVIPVLALGVPVADTCLTVVRRYLTGRPVFFPDQDHIHHRLVGHRRLSHRHTVLVLYLASAVFGGAAVLLAYVEDVVTVLGLLTLLAVGSYGFLYWLGYLHVRDIARLLKSRWAMSAPRPVTYAPLNGTHHGAAGQPPAVNGRRHPAAEKRVLHHTRVSTEHDR